MQLLSAQQENELLKYISKCAKIYSKLSPHEVKRLAYEYAKKIGVEYPSVWDDNGVADNNWFDDFLRRHSVLSVQKPEAQRVNGFNRENVNIFFNRYDSALDTFPHPYDATSIWTMDEYGFSTVSKANRVVTRKSAKNMGINSLVTTAVTVSASGNSIPPFFVFPRKNMQSIFMYKATSGAVGVANPSGWIQQTQFVKYIKHFVKYARPTKDAPLLLILDDSDSYLSVEALDMAAENGILIVSLPPHCSHRMQPLHAKVTNSIKACFHSQSDEWHLNQRGKVLDISYISEIVDRVLALSLTPISIKYGFENTGIFPYNTMIFNDYDFINSSLSGENSAIIEKEIRLLSVKPTAYPKVTASSNKKSSASCSTTGKGRKQMKNRVSDSSTRSRHKRLASNRQNTTEVAKIKKSKK